VIPHPLGFGARAVLREQGAVGRPAMPKLARLRQPLSVSQRHEQVAE